MHEDKLINVGKYDFGQKLIPLTVSHPKDEGDSITTAEGQINNYGILEGLGRIIKVSNNSTALWEGEFKN